MRTTFSYLTLGIKALSLCAKNSVKVFFLKSWMKISSKVRTFLLLFILLVAFTNESYAEDCEEGLVFCNNKCRIPNACTQGVPPPPGLPIDSKLPYLLIAGLGLGIYYWRTKKVA